MATPDEQMDTDNIESPGSVEDISSSSEASPTSFSDGKIAHKDIRNCGDDEEERPNVDDGDTHLISQTSAHASIMDNYNVDKVSPVREELSDVEADPSFEEGNSVVESNNHDRDLLSFDETENVNFDSSNAELAKRSSPQHSNSDHESNLSNEEALGDEDVDAPVPSPFSDIGDISGVENAMISDILKETNNAQHMSPVLDGFAENLDTINASLHDGDEENELDNSDNEQNDKKIDDGKEDNEKDSSDKEDTDEFHALKDESQNQDSGEFSKAGEGQEQSGYVGGLIADIFGDSDEEDDDEEFKGFNEEELQRESISLSTRSAILDDEAESKDDSDEGATGNDSITAKEDADVDDDENDEDDDDYNDDDKLEHGELQKQDASSDRKSNSVMPMMSDFDLMMKRKKEAMGHRRRRKSDSEVINDSDDIIAAMIQSMHDAVEEDRMLNQAGRAATKKLKMLDSVVTHLHKADLQGKFINGGVLPVMKEWLSPLPDNSLPHIMIRKQFLRLLSQFPPLNNGALKMSGIGRAVMLLYKHPKETRENRNLAGKIVSQWARLVFGVQTTFKDISKEEREERDKCNAAEYKKRRLSSTDDSVSSGSQEDKRPKRPGDKGFIARARVPKASNRDYIVRPRSDISLGEMGSFKNPKKVARSI